MAKRYHNAIAFTPLSGRRVEAEFSGAEVTSNGGVQLLAEADRLLGLTLDAAGCLRDDRRRKSVVHAPLSIIRQRLYALCLGHGDLNDHDRLRWDTALQAAVGRNASLASASTLCRFERKSGPEEATALHEALFEQFVRAHEVPPERVILDFDNTDIPLHGEQEGRHWHGHYRGYCYLPLYVFSGRHLLAAVLQRSSRDGASRAGAVLKLLVRALRREWPGVEVVLRGDCGFCRRRIMRWCEKAGVKYVLGLPSNSRVAKLAEPVVGASAALHRLEGTKQRLFDDFDYAALSWPKERRVVVKAEHMARGANTRYVVTNLDVGDDPQALYEGMYCERGDMENRIKDQQMDLFAARASSTDFWANQYRMLLSGLAYTLIEGLRRLGLKATELAKAAPNTIRLRLLRVGAVVLSNTRRVRLLMSRAHPEQALLRQVAASLAAQPP